MAIQPAICSNCGGSLKVDDVNLNGFCECKYCHTAHKVIDIITIDGLPTVKGLLENADNAIEDGNAEKAVKLYEEAIKIKPNCHEAWWGLYHCNKYFDQYYGYSDKYGNSGPLTKASIMQSTINKYADKAIKYAPPEKAAQYSGFIADDLQYIEQVRSGQFDKSSSSGKSGCYIATAIYGSYTCDEVLALRRYRDDYLAQSVLGRAFIKFYYAVSPTMAKHIRPESLLGRSIRNVLDNKVKKLDL